MKQDSAGINVQSLLQTAAVVLAILAGLGGQFWSMRERLIKVEEQHAHMLELLEKQEKIITESQERDRKIEWLIEQLLKQGERKR